jgi:hypothetical protein
MAQVQSIIRNGYMHLGNISTANLPIDVFLTNLQSVIDKRMVDLKLSDGNFLLKNWEFEGDDESVDFAISVSDFSEAVKLEYSEDGLNFTGNVELVNHANLYLNRREQDLTAAIYGSPARIEFSLIPNSLTTFRLWYEPSKGAPLRLTQEPELNTFFHSFLALEAAAMSVPDVAGRDDNWKRMKQQTLLASVAEWELRWTRWTEKPPNQGVVKKRRFNQRRGKQSWQ